MKKGVLTLLLSLWTVLILVSCSELGGKPLFSLTWTDYGLNPETGLVDQKFVLVNNSARVLRENWAVYYSQLPRNIIRVESSEVKISAVKAGYYKISPTEQFAYLIPHDSIVIHFSVEAQTTNISQEPEGAFMVISGRKPHAITLTTQAAPVDIQAMTAYAERVYDQNAQLRKVEPYGTLPSVKIREVEHDYRPALEVEAVKQVKGEVPELVTPLQKEEGYRLVINKEGITLTAETDHGLFNGLQTYKSLLKSNSEKILCQTIVDYPDLEYRGFMLDISRNYVSVENIRKMIALMASYKLNVLHLHLADDEGWRLEIPGLEELTEVGGHRGYTISENDHLFPAYDGHYNPDAETTGNGFITRSEFIDLLKYAAGQHVTIIPEIDTPGHSRAAIKAMKARYQKYADNPKKAKEYLLSEEGDISKYLSAQGYDDNVINMAMPSTYRFVEKVAVEIQRMYKEAGLPLTTLHLGGDECADGAWLGSSLCKKLMSQSGWSSTHELYQQYYLKVNAIMRRLGIRISGWQEAAFVGNFGNPSTMEGAEGYRENFAGVYCWNTIPEWGDDKVPYEVANSGYPVILCNVNNFYMDLAYSPLYGERGHFWAGQVDESKSFSALPFSIYRSARSNLQGVEWNLDSVAQGKPLLTPQGRANIKGVQAQLFSETIRGYEWVEYYVFPKILGLVERGWNAHPAWEAIPDATEERIVYFHHLSQFYAQLSRNELLYLSQQGVNFHLPSPGLKRISNLVYANTPIQGAEIRYTTDGTEPTASSPLYTQPIPCKDGIIKARLFFQGKESVSSVAAYKAVFD